MTTRRWSLWWACALAGVLLLIGGGPAWAAETPVVATLTGVTSSGGTVTGTLTVRTDAAVDAGSVAATVGGETAQVALGPAATGKRTTMILIDTSGSMGAQGMATVRAAVRTFLNAVPPDVLIGVASFANTAGVDVPPTADRAAVLAAVDGLTSTGETALYDGIDVAVAALGTQGDRSIVILSDGGDTTTALAGGDPTAKLDATVALVGSSHVRVEAVAFKSAEEKPAVLAAFAAAGGGSVVPAADSAAVDAAFTSAAKVLEHQQSVTVTTPAGLQGSQEVVLTGQAGGAAFEVKQTVDIGAPGTPPTPASASPSAASGGATARPSAGGSIAAPLWLGLALLLVLLGVFGLGLAFAAPALRSARSQRLASVEQYTRRAGRQVAQQVPTSGQLVELGERVMAGRESTRGTMLLIDRADLPWRAGEWFLIRLLAVLVGGILGYLLFSGSAPLVGIVVGVLVGLVLPSLFLRFMARRRRNQFEAELPDVMMLTATSLSSGFSLPQSLDAVARDAPQPAAKEFARALAEARIGTDISDALDHVAVRMDSENLRWTTMAIRIQREVGGNLADTLRTTAMTLREREMLRRQVRALSAEGRLSAYILIALPIALLLYSMLVNYEYVSLLWTTPIGWVMSVLGIVAMVIGIFWMRKVVQIEV